MRNSCIQNVTAIKIYLEWREETEKYFQFGSFVRADSRVCSCQYRRARCRIKRETVAILRGDRIIADGNYFGESLSRSGRR